ncbi:hypothetical protein ACVIRO_002399 [Rhizobium ruizarguesonis]
MTIETELPAEVIEEMAKAMCERDGFSWDAESCLETGNGDEPEQQREYWRDKAEAAFLAIPQMLTLKDDPGSGGDGEALSARMKAAGMYSIEEMLAEGKPLDKWMASTEVQDLPSFEAWLLRRYREFVTMQARYELGDRDKGDELYEWVNAHVGSFADVLANFRAALRKRREADG